MAVLRLLGDTKDEDFVFKSNQDTWDGEYLPQNIHNIGIETKGI